MARVRDVQAVAASREYSPMAPQNNESEFSGSRGWAGEPGEASASSSRKVNLNLSPYRDLSPKKEKFRKTTGPVLIAQNNPKVTPDDPTYFYWLYGYLEFKMTESEEAGMKKATKQIDRLVEKLQKLDAKGSLLFDIVSTRKYIATYTPHKLGRAIYKYVEEKYFGEITTTFVGLTDNTARRVARDVFCKNKELSRQKYGFDIVDNVHMFVIYPPVESRNRDGFAFGSPGVAQTKHASHPPK